MILSVRFILSGMLLCGIASSKPNDEEAYVIGLFPVPVRGNGTLPVSPPTMDNVQSIKVGIANYGETADDVAFHAYLPDYAEMTSFSMETEGVTYKGKKTNHQEAHDIMQEARTGDHNAAMLIPKPMSERYDNEIQTAANTVHIKAKKQMTFDLEYKESLKDMKEAGVKILNRARVAFDFYGTTVEDMVGELYSPNYPEPYPNSADITWWVRAPENKVVNLNLADLDIEECCDRLTVYDGSSIRGQVLAVLTGNLDDVTSLMLTSTKNSLFLHLTSDCSETRRGFKVTISAKQLESTTTPISSTTGPTHQQSDITACNGGDYLYSYYGSIQSPNYPSAYDINMNCSWTIQIPYFSYRVNLTVLDFHLETGYDYLQVYDGSSSSAPLLTSLTGHQSGTELVSSSNYLYLLFTSDDVTNWQGFSLQYTFLYPQPETPAQTTGTTTEETTEAWGSGGSGDDVCGGVEYLTANNYNNYIYSPNYPNSYYNYMDCSWQIQSHYYYDSVHVVIVNMDLENNYDFLKFYDGSSTSNRLIASYSGIRTSTSVYSYGSTMLIRFTSDGSQTRSGFQLAYHSD